MNDTETEARRLLAAATEDMPPGIDLLDGFAAARRRDRSRRTRRGAMLSAGIAAAAASVTAVTLTMGSAPPALAVVTSALTRTLAQSYHLSAQTTFYSYVNGQRSANQDPCTTEADPVRHMQATSCPDSEIPVTLEVGDYMYSYSRGFQNDNGKPWQRMRIVCTPPPSFAINGFTVATPQQMLAAVKEATTVTVAGPASGPGWTGTRYAFSATESRAKLSGSLTVDRQGRARSLVLTIWTIWPSHGRSEMKQLLREVLTFSDFGAPVMVTPPPADQTYFDNVTVIGCS